MLSLLDLTPGTYIRGLIADQVAQVLSIAPVTSEIATLVLKDSRGQLSERLVYPEDLQHCELVVPHAAYQFDGDAASLRLVSEALRIQLAHLFDPFLDRKSTRLNSSHT